MSLSKFTSGTKWALYADFNDGNGDQFLGLETTNSVNIARELVDVSNKMNANVRTIIPNEGRVTADVTSEIYFDDNAAAQLAIAAFESGDRFKLSAINFDTKKANYASNVFISNVGDTGADGAGYTRSITFSSDGKVNTNPPDKVAVELDYTISQLIGLHADDIQVYAFSSLTNVTEVFNKFTGANLGTWSTPAIRKMWTFGDFVYYVNNTSNVIKKDRLTGNTVATIDLSTTGLTDTITGDLYGTSSIAFLEKSSAAAKIVAYLDTTDDSVTFDTITNADANNASQFATLQGATKYPYIISNVTAQGSTKFYTGFETVSSARELIISYDEAPLLVRDGSKVYASRGQVAATSAVIDMNTGNVTSFGVDRAFSFGYTEDSVFIINSDNLFKRYDKITYTEQEDITAVNPGLMTSDELSNAVWWTDSGNKIYSIQEL